MTNPISQIDPSAIHPDNLAAMANPNKKFGSCLQDCAVIIQTYERGAHSTYTEPAVFATMSKILESTKNFAANTQASMGSYLRQPVEQTTGSGSSTLTQNDFQGVKIGGVDVSTLGSAFGQSLMEWMKQCIPCSDRILALMELHPNIDLLGALESDIKQKLKMLTDIANILTNINIYADYCDFLKLLSFMCIPDLQRLVALLAMLLANQTLELDGLIGLLQALIAPLFAPILMGITSMLDQFASVVLSPITCIIDAINEQLRKLNYEASSSGALQDGIQEVQKAGEEAKSAIQSASAGLKGGLKELNSNIVYAQQYVQNKLKFYIDQLKAMLGELGFGDIAYLNAALRKLTMIRLIAFIVAVILAISKGQPACTPGKSPEASELDNFFNNFLNPNGSFNLWIDEDGSLHVDEKVPDFPDTLPNSGNVLKYEGQDIVDTSILQQIEVANNALGKTVEIRIPCKLETTTVDEANKVNQWIQELNSIT